MKWYIFLILWRKIPVIICTKTKENDRKMDIGEGVKKKKKKKEKKTSFQAKEEIVQNESDESHFGKVMAFLICLTIRFLMQHLLVQMFAHYTSYIYKCPSV